jgi:hypothetical protein
MARPGPAAMILGVERLGMGQPAVKKLHASCRGKLQAGQGKGYDHAKSQMAFGSGNDKSLKTAAD